MHLKNSFTDETRNLFIWKYDCDVCGMNGWDALHHILGRESNSPLNAATVHNDKCHIGNGTLSTFSERKRLLKKIHQFLMKNEYRLTDDDQKFMLKNKKYYV